MKAIAQMNPNWLDLKLKELALFMQYQSEFLAVLDYSKNYDLNGCQIPTVIFKWLTINLDDTLRFVVSHNERHLLHGQNCLKVALADGKYQ